MRLRESVALITGASKGLGLEIAREYAECGARLVIAARHPEALDRAATELRKKTEVVSVTVDVSQEAERFVEAGLERFGRIDVLVNNASELGPSPMPRLESLSWQDMEHILRVNVTAPLHLTQLVLRQMRARSTGVIINVTSDAGVEAYAGWGGYGASKAALEHMSRVLSEELSRNRSFRPPWAGSFGAGFRTIGGGRGKPIRPVQGPGDCRARRDYG